MYVQNSSVPITAMATSVAIEGVLLEKGATRLKLCAKPGSISDLRFTIFNGKEIVYLCDIDLFGP